MCILYCSSCGYYRELVKLNPKVNVNCALVRIYEL